jgi:hypothetical protein
VRRAAGALVLGVSLAAGCAATGTAPEAMLAVALRNAGFEEADPAARCAIGWGCTSHADPSAFRFLFEEAAPASGKRSFCIERVRDEPWALVTQEVEATALRGSRIRLSIALRLEGATGNGAGPWVVAQGSASRLHDQKLVNATRGWQRVAVEMAVPGDARYLEVGVALEGGGRACFDDARLEIVQAAKTPV